MAISALWLPGNSQADDRFAASRDRLVKLRIEAAGVKDSRVLQAIRSTPRHLFVPREDWGRAYYDMALPIGHGQTISSPFIVASMTEALEPDEDDKVLEIGTGSGYQAAVLSPLVKEVYSIEIVRELGESAAEVIKDLKLENVHTRVGDGFKGWPEAAPFDKIIVTCSPEKVPQPLIDQLVEGGMMIVPVGERYQQTMYRMIKKDGKLERQALRPTLFVPMTGAAEASRERLPDPKNPRLINGDFSQAPPAGATNQVDFVPGWYYGRQVKRIEDSLSHAPYVRFENETPGLSSHLLQGIAIDGTSVGTIRLATRYRSDGVRRGDEADQLPAIVISFYDGVRADLGAEMIGPFRNSRSWRDASRLIRVPPRAREAIVRIGLFGATGVIEFDDVELKKVGD